MGPRWREAEMGREERGRPEAGIEPCRTGGMGGSARHLPAYLLIHLKLSSEPGLLRTRWENPFPVPKLLEPPS